MRAVHHPFALGELALCFRAMLGMAQPLHVRHLVTATQHERSYMVDVIAGTPPGCLAGRRARVGLAKLVANRGIARGGESERGEDEREERGENAGHFKYFAFSASMTRNSTSPAFAPSYRL